MNETWRSTDRVRLNVGGKKFETLVETLAQCRYFENLLSGERWVPVAKSEQPIFVNRCGRLFKHLLRWLVDRRYRLPTECLAELDFYGIEAAPSPPKVLRLCARPFEVAVGPRWASIHTLVFPRERLVWVQKVRFLEGGSSEIVSSSELALYLSGESSHVRVKIPPLDSDLDVEDLVDRFVRAVAFEGEVARRAPGSCWYIPTRLSAPLALTSNGFLPPCALGNRVEISDRDFAVDFLLQTA